MAHLTESPTYESGIYQIEKTDPVVGGIDGISNRQARQLANRTTYLKGELERLLQQAKTLESELDQHQRASDPHQQYLNNARGDARYLGKGAKAADSARLNGAEESSSTSKSTLAKRNGDGDLHARLFRSTYAEQSNEPNANADIAFRNNKDSDNYIRFMTKGAMQSWMDLNGWMNAHLKITFGRQTTTARYSKVGWWNGYDGTGNNYTDIYPPSGYSMSHLAGFIASIGVVHYAGGVNGDDSIWLKAHYYSNRVRVVCNNSENRSSSQINYLAIWRK